MSNLYYLGPPGTFTHQAAKGFAKTSKIALQPTNNTLEIVERLRSSKRTEYGILPYYNHLAGLVQETLDQIFQHNLQIIGLKRLPISFLAGGFERTQKIYSHAKSLQQTSHWINKYYPQAELITVASNAQAVQLVKKQQQGIAIAGKQAFSNSKLRIIAEKIENQKENFTEFYNITNQQTKPQQHDNRTMIAISPNFDQPGLLANILNQISYYDINLAKIHSRPAINKHYQGAQMFYIEMQCHPNANNLKQLIQAIEYRLGTKSKHSIKILGSYKY